MKTPLAIADVLDILEHPNGGFVDFNPNKPNIYATYYYMKALDLPCFNQEIPHRTKTVNWIEQLAEQGFNLGDSREKKLNNIYLGVKCLRFLEIPVNQSKVNAIAETIETIMGCSPKEVTVDSAQYNLRTVYRILDIFDTLNLDLGLNAEFESWLTVQWRTWESSDFPAKVSDILQSYRSLQLIGYNRDEILNIWDPRDEVASTVCTPAEWSINEEFDLLNIGGTRNILTELKIDESLPNSVVQSIATSQNQDGGFSLLADSISDCRGTYIVLDLLSQRSEIDTIDHEAAINFILYNAVFQGGFSLHYRQDPGFNQTFAIHWLMSNTSDKYDLTTDVDYTIPDGLYTEKPLTPNKLYKILTIHERTRGSPPTVDVDAFISTYLNTVPSLNVPENDLLKNIYYSLLLDQDFASKSQYHDFSGESIVDTVLDTRNEKGGFGEEEPAHILSTFHAVYSLKYLGYQLSNQERLIDWLRAHRNEDGGFGEETGANSLSDIVSTYFAVRTLLLLDVEINDTQSIQSWLDDFRHVNGGWPRGPQYDDPRARYTVLAVDLKRRLDKSTGRSGTKPTSAN